MGVSDYSEQHALVVLSGGQDSTTCLFWAKHKFKRVSAVCFSYSQRHATEIECATRIAMLAGVELEIIDLGPIFAGLSPLTNRAVEVGRYESAAVLPGGLEQTFVPGRNILFLTVAANRAYVLGADVVIIGVGQEDFGGYPDCRSDFIEAMQTALSRGLGKQIEIAAPLMNLSKRETVLMATQYEGALEALAFSHTCYAGEFPPCGHCHACLLRQRGFDDANIEDPLLARARATVGGGR
jgi:7-cyano-7-deazaguanine synthase